MSTAKKTPTRKTTPNPVEAAREEDVASSSMDDRSVYVDFTRWTSKQSPKWHPVKKMRYVFWRMINGCTTMDALREIHWSGSEFWHLLDVERNAPFRVEFKRARQLQGRAFGDQVMTIAEGRDRTTKKGMTRVQRMIEKALKKAGKQKSPLAAKAIIESLLFKIEENDRGIIARNKLQMDGAKWIAKTANPTEFSDKSSLSLDGGIAPSGEVQPILIQFIGADGNPVTPK